MSIQKITEDEVRALWVQRLSDTPNRQGRFGTMGLSAAEMKAVYDALPLRIVTAYNALVDAIRGGELSAFMKSEDGITLSEFLNGVRSGSLAAMLTVDGERTLSALAAALDTHDHDAVYARLGENGRLAPEHLPSGYESVFAAAEAERAAAEAERAAAELRREATLVTVCERLDESDRRESERDALLTEHTGRIASAEEALGLLHRRVEGIGHTVENLSAAGLGVTHRFYEDATPAYRKSIPTGVLPYATLSLLGGAAERGKRVTVGAVTSYSGNLLAYPYPAVNAAETTDHGITFRQMTDGEILISGTAERNVSYFLYTERDGLALPTDGVYIDSQITKGVTLYVKSGTSGAVWETGRFIPSPDDGYYGSYAVYLYIEKGTVLDGLLVKPSIAYGTEPRHAPLYRKPHRVEIPAEVLALPGYGHYENVLDLENGCYRQRRTEGGVGMSEEILYPLPEALAAALTIPVEPGGYIELENPQGAAVESTVEYVIKVS